MTTDGQKKDPRLSTMSGQGDQAAARESWVRRLWAMTRASRQRDLALHLGGMPSPKNDETLLSISDLKIIKQLESGRGNNRL